jgi:hypothetical protein
MTRLTLYCLLILLLTACAPDPRKQAIADETISGAQQNALDRSQQRQIAADLHQSKMSDLAAATTARQTAQQLLWQNLGYSLIALIWVSSLGIAVGVAYTSIAASRAIARRAELQANLVRLDPVTRQYPLLLQYVGKGSYTLANPNTGSVMYLDTRQPEHRQLIQASGAVQLAGVIAREAAHSRDPRGLASIMPILTDMTTVEHS